jgi:hypothetical protein
MNDNGAEECALSEGSANRIDKGALSKTCHTVLEFFPHGPAALHTAQSKRRQDFGLNALVSADTRQAPPKELD